jgi:hypothetical protein
VVVTEAEIDNSEALVDEAEQIAVNTEPVVVTGTIPNDTDFPVASHR